VKEWYICYIESIVIFVWLPLLMHGFVFFMLQQYILWKLCGNTCCSSIFLIARGASIYSNGTESWNSCSLWKHVIFSDNKPQYFPFVLCWYVCICIQDWQSVFLDWWGKLMRKNRIGWLLQGFSILIRTEDVKFYVKSISYYNFSNKFCAYPYCGEYFNIARMPEW